MSSNSQARVGVVLDLLSEATYKAQEHPKWETTLFSLLSRKNFKREREKNHLDVE